MAVEERAAASEQRASGQAHELQGLVASLRAEVRARGEAAAALEARLQEAQGCASSAAADRRRLEARLQEQAEVESFSFPAKACVITDPTALSGVTEITSHMLLNLVQQCRSRLMLRVSHIFTP